MQSECRTKGRESMRRRSLTSRRCADGAQSSARCGEPEPLRSCAGLARPSVSSGLRPAGLRRPCRRTAFRDRSLPSLPHTTVRNVKMMRAFRSANCSTRADTVTSADLIFTSVDSIERYAHEVVHRHVGGWLRSAEAIGFRRRQLVVYALGGHCLWWLYEDANGMCGGASPHAEGMVGL